MVRKPAVRPITIVKEVPVPYSLSGIAPGIRLGAIPFFEWKLGLAQTCFDESKERWRGIACRHEGSLERVLQIDSIANLSTRGQSPQGGLLNI